MNYQELLDFARKGAREVADKLYAPGDNREAYYRWLVVRRYLDSISPIMVAEAQTPPETRG